MNLTRILLLFLAFWASGVASAQESTSTLPIRQSFPVPVQSPDEMPLAVPISSMPRRTDSALGPLPIRRAPQWVVREGQRIRSIVETWADLAGWKVRWIPADIDYTADGSHTFNGDFKTAVSGLFAAIPFEDIEPKSRVRMRFINDNNPPLVLVTYDDGVEK